MFHSVSWEDYWIVTSVSCVVYYLIIYFLYFRKAGELSPQLNGTIGKEGLDNSVTLSSHLQHDIAPYENNLEDEDYILQACLDELTAFFENQRKTKPVRSELLFSLCTLLQKYPSLASSDYRESLSTIISSQCQMICSIHLSTEELKGVWLGM